MILLINRGSPVKLAALSAWAMPHPMTLPASAPPGAGVFATLLGQLAFGLFAMTLCIPSMQDWPAIFGATQAQVQLTFSGYVAAYGGMQLVYGPLSDRVGRKPALMAGLVLAIAGSLLALLATDLWTLVAGRVLQGVGAAAGMVVGRALVQDLFAGAQRTRMMAFVGMTMGLCPVLAVVVGGQLHVRWGWQANFVLTLVLGLVLLIASWRSLAAGRPAGASAPVVPQRWWRQVASGYAALAREPVYLLYVVILSATTATMYTFMAGAPIVLARYGVGPQDLGWYVMAVPLPYILGNLITSRLIHRLGDRRLMVLGQALTLTGLLVMLALALAGVASPLALVLPLTLMGAGHGLLMPPTLSGAVGLVPALAGSAAAVGGLMQQLTGALGGYAVGLVPHRDAVNLALMMLALSSCAALALALLIRRRQKPPT